MEAFLADEKDPDSPDEGVEIDLAAVVDVHELKHVT